MTKSKAHLSKSIAFLSASLLFGTAAFAATVYDNSVNLLDRSFSPSLGQEFGDQVFLSGNERKVSDFQFDYFVQGSGNETAELFFYKNDNVGSSGTTPGSLLYQSGQFSLSQGFQTAVLQALSVTVPNTFTWTVKFGGIGIGEQVGLLLSNPATVGTSVDDYWMFNDGTWATFLIDGGTTPANFSARITAVPEPSAVVLALLGGLTLLGFRRAQRRSV